MQREKQEKKTKGTASDTEEIKRKELWRTGWFSALVRSLDRATCGAHAPHVA